MVAFGAKTYPAALAAKLLTKLSSSIFVSPSP